MLVSRDPVQWEERGGALPPLEMEGAEDHWAPEVAYRDGRFYVYFAAGRSSDSDDHLRLAAEVWFRGERESSG